MQAIIFAHVVVVMVIIYIVLGSRFVLGDWSFTYCLALF